MLERHKGVQQGLNALARAARLERGAGEVLDHLLVGHRVALLQGPNLLHAQQGELRRGDGQHVRTGRLDGEALDLPPHVVGEHQLGGGVAAVDVDHGPVAAQQITPVDEPFEVGQGLCFALVP